ncbi:hypothetical protein AAFF_G00192830 [Aldrovandia affinis]|uniref:Mitochondrial import inner membrane translocase subunit TIM50 n=1 Tax=Aldrovandia affinis TaxID=143900 RepID=A0AAD7RJA7_9TELE|nr:hypothetical protein AAFF_G00192830 [Aldrovandia affinis]
MCLLHEVMPQDQGKICVVIDLDETLVHSSFKPISNADFIVPVEIEGMTHQVILERGHLEARTETCLALQVYVLKRPHVDEFLQQMGEMFECILFTASLAKLFRESCVFHQGCYVKDLSRQLHRTLILDNSPASYIFHPENASLFLYPSLSFSP